ncbi:MAG: putative toxin-antitoxin system toxin component, PIN family [Xanthomonadaceae bacterium]|nr:putative toxin-antitoxin system toxin component, PIN family [Xanthomonadaceae bacterium]MDE2084001.1 putative toxin-antitoxin system toxin component, PIN family [Xanthomonadaceae bacterium]
MNRVVLDTNVIVAAFRSRRGASNRLLRLVADGAVIPLLTTALFLEYEDVLTRAEHRLATGLGEIDVQRVLAALASAAEPVEVHFRWRPQLPDPADELVLEAAVNGQADALITHNIRDFAAAAKRFKLRVATPGDYLEELIS